MGIFRLFKFAGSLFGGHPKPPATFPKAVFKPSYDVPRRTIVIEINPMYRSADVSFVKRDCLKLFGIDECGEMNKKVDEKQEEEDKAGK